MYIYIYICVCVYEYIRGENDRPGSCRGLGQLRVEGWKKAGPCSSLQEEAQRRSWFPPKTRVVCLGARRTGKNGIAYIAAAGPCRPLPANTLLQEVTSPTESEFRVGVTGLTQNPCLESISSDWSVTHTRYIHITIYLYIPVSMYVFIDIYIYVHTKMWPICKYSHL